MAEQDDTGFPRGIGAPATRALHGAGYTQRVLQEALGEKGMSLG